MIFLLEIYIGALRKRGLFTLQPERERVREFKEI